MQPVKQSHTARNILIVFAVLFLLFVGGCVAVVAVVGNEVNDAVNDDTLGGPNNPLTITEGQALRGRRVRVRRRLDDRADAGQRPGRVDNLKVTNHRGKADRLLVEIKLLERERGVATSTCTAGDGLDKIPEDITVDRGVRRSSDPLPAGLRQDHDQRHHLGPVTGQRSCRAGNVAGGAAMASWAATSWISRVPAASVASRTANTDAVVRSSAVAGEPVVVRCAR